MDFFDLNLARKGGGGGGGITPAIKTALLGCFSKVAWVDENGQDYYDTLMNAMYSPADLSSISAVYSGGNIPSFMSLDEVKNDLVVTAHWSDSSTSTVGASYYELSGTLNIGSDTLTVTYLGKTTTLNVTVEKAYRLSSTFTSSGSENIDTDMHLPESGTMTVAEEFIVSSFKSSIGYIFGNKISSSSDYLALQSQSSSGNRIWGVGINWNNSTGKANANETVRMVHIFTISNNGINASVTAHFKNVTTSSSNKYTNTYTSSSFSYGTYPIVIGNQHDNNGFTGTVSKFIVQSGTWTDDQISSFLNSN